MRRCALQLTGVAPSERNRRGFTLLEMCIVLFILVILMGVMIPTIQSAFTEQAVRRDGSELALMVKTAMLQSADEQRPYVISITATNMALYPAAPLHTDPDLPATPPSDDTLTEQTPLGLTVDWPLTVPNKILIPDPEKHNAWTPLVSTEWWFQPGDLCAASKLRVTRGEAWLELNFNPLTGAVENEASYFP